jgi:hypothetical protein
MWGAGLSHENVNVTEAECVRVHEGRMCAVAMRDGVAPSGSKAVSRMESKHRNMRGPTGAAGLIPGGGWRQGNAGAIIRAEVGSRTGP